MLRTAVSIRDMLRVPEGLVFFGFTHCPDVCPTTLVELAAVKRALGPDGDRVQGIFVTVDPERDRPRCFATT